MNRATKPRSHGATEGGVGVPPANLTAVRDRGERTIALMTAESLLAASTLNAVPPMIFAATGRVNRAWAHLDRPGGYMYAEQEARP